MFKYLPAIMKHSKKRLSCNTNYLLNLSAINENVAQPLTSPEKDILQNLLAFRELKVSEVMIPRTDIVGIEYTSSFDIMKQLFITAGHTRMPVYRENLDDIVGFVHVKDFIPYMDGSKAFKLNNIMRKVLYLPRSTKCMDLLVSMRNGATHFAVVLDEYGGTEGIVLIENLLERIVGDIRDEHDQVIKVFTIQLEPGVYMIDARASMQDVEQTLRISLSEEDGDYETFSGFILSYLGYIPEKGEKFIHPVGIEIDIVDADLRKIKNVKVTLQKAQEP